MNLTLSQNAIYKLQNALNFINSYIKTEEYENLLNFLKNKINSNSRIVISGVGKNSHIARKISETLASLGIKSFFLNSCHTFHGDFGFLEKDDIIIYISKSGTTKEIQSNIEYIFESGEFSSIKQILIHCNKNLEISNKLQFSICLNDVIENDEHELAPTTSTTIILFFLDLISIELSKFIKFKREDFYKFHPGGSLGNKLKTEFKK